MSSYWSDTISDSLTYSLIFINKISHNWDYSFLILDLIFFNKQDICSQRQLLQNTADANNRDFWYQVAIFYNAEYHNITKLYADCTKFSGVIHAARGMRVENPRNTVCCV
jgi:hypothetical protein